MGHTVKQKGLFQKDWLYKVDGHLPINGAGITHLSLSKIPPGAHIPGDVVIMIAAVRSRNWSLERLTWFVKDRQHSWKTKVLRFKPRADIKPLLLTTVVMTWHGTRKESQAHSQVGGQHTALLWIQTALLLMSISNRKELEPAPHARLPPT